MVSSSIRKMDIEMNERLIDVAFDCIAAATPQCHRCVTPCDVSIAEFHSQVRKEVIDQETSIKEIVT